MGRIKKLRVAILPALIEGNCTAPERADRWRHLEDCTFAQALESYPRGYIDGEPTTERLLETVERFEENTTDTSRVHRPMRAAWTLATPCPLRPSGRVVRPTRSPFSSKSD